MHTLTTPDVVYCSVSSFKRPETDRHFTTLARVIRFVIMFLVSIVHTVSLPLFLLELLVLFTFFTIVLCQWDFFHRKFGLPSPGKAQLRQSRATQPKVHAGCLSVSIIHRTLIWTAGSLTCAQM